MDQLLCVTLLLLTLSLVVSATGSNESCNTWFYWSPEYSVCLCHNSIEGYINCSQQQNTSYLHIGKALGSNGQEAMVAHIPYIYPKKVVEHFSIALNRTLTKQRQYICGKLNRYVSNNDHYCGHCNNKSGYGPAIYSFGLQCAKCHPWNGTILYFALQLLPISIFYGAVLVFNIDLTRPTMFHYIVFCNAITFMFRYSSGLVMSYLYSSWGLLGPLMKLSLTLSGVWSLDFLRFVVPPFCIGNKVHECVIPFFDFFPVVYLLIVTGVISVLIKLYRCRLKPVLVFWKPAQRALKVCRLTRDPVEAVMHTYATFFFLYLYKTLSVAFLTALTSPALSQNGTKTHRLTVYYDPTTSYFERGHIAIVMSSFTTAAILIIPALALLTFYRTAGIQRFCTMQLGPQTQKILRIFVQTLENGYKDGTNGTKDCRHISGIFFFAVILGSTVCMILFRQLQYTDNIPWVICVIGFTSLAVMYGSVRPYKKRSDNNMAVFIYGVLIVTTNIICFIQQRSRGPYAVQREIMLILLMGVILFTNLIYSVYIAYKVFRYFKINERVFNLARIVCHLCRCPCRRLLPEDEDEEQRLLSHHHTAPNYYQ